jgi:O-antigen ligase
MTPAFRWNFNKRSLIPVALGKDAAAFGVTPGLASRLPMIAAALSSALAWLTILSPERWLTIFFICSLLLPPLPFPIGNSGVHVAPLVALLGLVAGVVRAREWRAPASSRHENLPLLFVLFLAVLTVSVAFAAVYSGWKIALGSLARVFLFGIGVYVFFYTLLGPREKESDSLTFARFLFWVGLTGAAFACIDFYFQLPALARYAPQFVWLKHSVLRRAQGVFYEASTLGNFCAFFLVMILVASFPPKGERLCSRFTLISGAVVFAAALILTSSRASVVTVVLAGCMFAWLRRLKLKIVVIAACACLSAAALVVRAALPAFSANYWSRMTLSTQHFWSYPNEVLSGRVTYWKALVYFLAQHPWHLLFGIGYKTIPYTDYIGTRLVADNTYLSLLVETGIVGLSAFAILNMAILRTAYRAARSTKGRASFFGTWVFCFWCGETVQMLSGDLITYWRVLPLYFWVLATAARESGE